MKHLMWSLMNRRIKRFYLVLNPDVPYWIHFSDLRGYFSVPNCCDFLKISAISAPEFTARLIIDRLLRLVNRWVRKSEGIPNLEQTAKNDCTFAAEIQRYLNDKWVKIIIFILHYYVVTVSNVFIKNSKKLKIEINKKKCYCVSLATA